MPDDIVSDEELDLLSSDTRLPYSLTTIRRLIATVRHLRRELDAAWHPPIDDDDDFIEIRTSKLRVLQENENMRRERDELMQELVLWRTGKRQRHI